MSEWLKVHAWKACVRQQRTGGSNPPLSATKFEAHFRGVAQSGSASALGAEGRRFESCHPDH